jgi:glycerol-3-phosphate dehydrogenase
MKTAKIDIAIIGGGIAGLWVLNRLRLLGYSVILLEAEALGGGQTSKAQGIIHGGTKYALQGMMTSAAQSIAEMPALWRQCLAGKGEIDLSNVQVLSERQYLWSPGTLAGKLSGFFANVALNSQVQPLAHADFPDIFQHPDFKGQVYVLDEMVIDMNSLIRKLVKPHQDAIFKIDAIKSEDLIFDSAGYLTEVKIHAGPLEPGVVKAQKYIFTAGAGNELLLKCFEDQSVVAMQKRPLHMVMLKTDFLYPLYAHCLGMSATPRLTITTHTAHDGRTVWYLGGQLAEEGRPRDEATQVEATKKELKELFPWVDIANAQFASFFVDRAEGLQANGKRPDSYVKKEIKNITVAWPTKFALAPTLSEEIIKSIQASGFQSQIGDLRSLRGWPMPSIAKPIWDDLL